MEKWSRSIRLFSLFACIVVCVASWLIFSGYFRDVSILDGLSSAEQAEAAILARVPLGSSRTEVENFIAEELQGSESSNCGGAGEREAICIMSHPICDGMMWHIDFYFYNEELADIRVAFSIACLK